MNTDAVFGYLTVGLEKSQPLSSSCISHVLVVNSFDLSLLIKGRVGGKVLVENQLGIQY